MAKHVKTVVKPVAEPEAPKEEAQKAAPVVEEEIKVTLYTANIGLTNPYTLQRFEPGLKVEPIMDSWTVCQIEAGIIFPC